MTTINNLPDEVLSLIFKDLKFNDLNACQYVCRALYSRAHVLLLKNIKLQSVSHIERFIISIDNNPQHSYLAAVKKICIGNLQQCPIPKRYIFDSGKIKKLFARFFNVEQIVIHDDPDIYEGFNDDICKELAKSCPKLKKFEVTSTEARYSSLVLTKVRLLITKLNTDKMTTSEQSLIRFPRLQEIDGFFRPLQVFYPLIDQLPDLNIIKMISMRVFENPESYITTKSEEEKTAFIERLSQITSMDLTLIGIENPDLIMSLVNYLTGLNSARMHVLYESSWSDLQKELLCYYILNMICSVNHGYLCFDLLRITDLSTYLPSIVNKVFHQTTTNTTLQLNISPNAAKRNPPLEHTGKFVLCIKDKYYAPPTTVDMYEEILKSLPLVKEVVLDIPSSFQSVSSNESKVTCSQVFKLTIRPNSSFFDIYSILTRFVLTFPSLKWLNICYLNGVWDSPGNLYVSLENYSLEKLSIDLTSLKRRSKSFRGWLTITDYFVVKLQFSGSHESQLFKVPFTQSAVSSIKKEDLDGLGCTVYIKSLQTLEFLFRDIYEDEDDEDEEENNDDDNVYEFRKRVDFQLVSIPLI